MPDGSARQRLAGAGPARLSRRPPAPIGLGRLPVWQPPGQPKYGGDARIRGERFDHARADVASGARDHYVHSGRFSKRDNQTAPCGGNNYGGMPHPSPVVAGRGSSSSSTRDTPRASTRARISAGRRGCDRHWGGYSTRAVVPCRAPDPAPRWRTGRGAPWRSSLLTSITC